MARNRRRDEISDGMEIFWKAVSDSIKYMKILLASKNPFNKLRVIIILLFASILGSNLILYFHKGSQYELMTVIIFGIFMGGFGLILGKPYMKILDFFIELGSDEENALRWITTILLIDLPIAVAATIFMNSLLAQISLWILIGQVPIIFLSSIKQLNIWNAPKEVIPVNSSFHIWGVLGKINTVLGIITSIITIVLLFFI